MGVNKVVYNNRALIDLTSDSVTADTLKKGSTAHDNKGNLITGTATFVEGFKMLFTNMTVPVSAWAASTTYAWLPYKAEITCQGVTTSDYPTVIFSKESLDYLDLVDINVERSSTEANKVIVYASDIPTSSLSIDRIEIT